MLLTFSSLLAPVANRAFALPRPLSLAPCQATLMTHLVHIYRYSRAPRIAKCHRTASDCTFARSYASGMFAELCKRAYATGAAAKRIHLLQFASARLQFQRSLPDMRAQLQWKLGLSDWIRHHFASRLARRCSLVARLVRVLARQPAS